MSHSVLKLAVDNYMKKVLEITCVYDSKFYEVCKKSLYNTLLSISTEKVNGIVIGCYFLEDGTRPPKNRQGLSLSTGVESKHFRCLEREKAIQQLKTYHNKNKKEIVFLRFPFIKSSHTEEEFERLGEAFIPILNLVLLKVVNVKEYPLPVLTLGENANIFATEAMRKTRKPRFQVLSTVHPNYFYEVDRKIQEARNESTKKRNKKTKRIAYEQFTSTLNDFKFFCNVSANYDSP